MTNERERALTLEKMKRIPLKSVNGSATFTREPSKELLEAINNLALKAYEMVGEKITDPKCKKHGVPFDWNNGKPICPICNPLP